ncbi:hypothetical protein [Luteipulveratus mongoliensis]|uniref:hypothetical protein n=1 Tax=Luteipulveratus mongoliensis TaxID=571913 RepID=UPI0006989D0E|nr:hypothetical protein [Luteipulveratus mongoliensis]
MKGTLYRESAVSRRAWIVLGAVCVVAYVGLVLVVGHRPLDLILALVLIGMLGLIVANLLYSKNRYGSITIADGVLRVGRERIPLGSIDPQSISANDPHSPQPIERLADSAGAIKRADGTLLNEAGRLAGGAWAIPLGSDFISLIVNDERVAVTTNDRAGLLAALREASDA